MIEIKTEQGCVVAKITAANPNIHGCEEGVWIELQATDLTKPTLCFIKDKPNGTFEGDWYIGAYRNANVAPLGCDFAIRFSKDGPIIQMIKGGEVKIIHLYDIFTFNNGTPSAKEPIASALDSKAPLHQSVGVTVSHATPPGNSDKGGKGKT